MGVYIKGMEMPTEGGTICVYKISGEFFAARAGKDELFPIIAVPEPHGELIDMDDFLSEWSELESYRTAMRLCSVIPASEKEE